jgi:hypothetical protein
MPPIPSMLRRLHPKSVVVDVKPAFVALPMTVPIAQAYRAAQANARIDIQRNGTTVSDVAAALLEWLAYLNCQPGDILAFDPDAPYELP